MEKIKSRNQVNDDFNMNLARKIYNIEFADRVCAANKYMEAHREDLLEYALDKISINVTIHPYSPYNGDDAVICNNIIISFIDNDMDDIADNFIGLEYGGNEDPTNYYTKFICEAVYEYIGTVNDMLLKILQLRSSEFNYVSRKVLVTPMDKTRLSYYESLLREIILSTYSEMDVEDIVHSIFG